MEEKIMKQFGQKECMLFKILLANTLDFKF